jgi:hypothetical protein
MERKKEGNKQRKRIKEEIYVESRVTKGSMLLAFPLFLR